MSRYSAWRGRVAVAGLAVLVAAACSSREPAGQEKETGHEHGEHHDEHGHEGEGQGESQGEQGHARLDKSVLRVDSSMLRDLRLTTARAESRAAGDMVTALGELRVNEDAYAEIGSSIQARIVRVLAAPGDVVAAGQVLVELDGAEVGRARAAAMSARARLELARRTLERRRDLATDRIVSAGDVQATEAEVAEAQAELGAAQTALQALGGQRGSGARFALASPVAGTVLDRTAVRGRLVDAEETLFRVADLARLWLVVHAFERDALRLRPGATASVSFAALPGQRFDGVVARIGNRVDVESRTIDVRIDIDNPSGVLRPGMSATAMLPMGEDSDMVVAVPAAALQRLAQGWHVFIPGPGIEGQFEVRAVGRGRDLGGEVEVLTGLRAGETVVVDGAFLLKAEVDKARGGGEDHHHH